MFTASPPPRGGAAVLLLGLLCAVPACERKNASHCGNLSGDATCAAIDEGARPWCSLCEAAYDGCVIDPPEPVCRKPEDASSFGPTSDGTSTGPEATSATSATSAASGATDPGTTAATDDGPSDGGASTGGPVCGDGIVEGDLEKCEPGDGETGPDLQGETCTSLGAGRGELGCAADCRYDFSGCSSCGNDMIDGREECDGSDLGEHTECVDYDADVYIDGPLGCRANCTYDVTDCVLCTAAGGDCEDTAECCGSAACGVVTKTCGLL
jgi:hypothetical protein